MPRYYKDEYRKFQSSEKAKKARARRNRDRRAAERKHGKSALKGKDVDHSQNGAKGKTRLRSVNANRGDKKGVPGRGKKK